MLGKTPNGHQPKPAAAWRVTVEAWLRCQGLIAVRQNQKPNVSTTVSQKLVSQLNWTHRVNNFTNVVTYTGGNTTNVTTLTLPAQVTLAYDADENLISDGLHGYTYNADESLAVITVTNGWKSEFTYDGLMRRRVRKEYTWSGSWVLTNEVHYIYDGSDVLQERDASNTPQVTYTYAHGLRARTTSTETALYQKDALGSTTALVNRNGTVLARYGYDPFGNVLAKSGPLADANLYRYVGQEVHPNSGLIHHQFRYYDPNLQRWLNRDPIAEQGHRVLRGACTTCYSARSVKTSIPICSAATGLP